MAKVFNIFSGVKEDKNSKVVKNLLGSHIPSSSRPSSAIKRPVSVAANSNLVSAKSAKTKANKVSQLDPESYNQTSREEFISELIDLKRKIRSLEEKNSHHKADSQRLEAEATKQQRRIDQLLNLSEGAKSLVITSDIRKDIEKSILVRQLKEQITTLRGALNEKDNEIDSLKRSIRATHVSEAENERDEYFMETQRLHKMLLEAQDELLRERQRREWNSKLAGGTGDDLRKEVARLATGYQNILSNISNKNGGNRPSSSSGGRSAINNATKGEDGRAKRPQSAVAKTSLTNYLNNDLHQTPNRSDQNSAIVAAESPVFEDPLDNFGLNRNATHRAGQSTNGEFVVTASSPFAMLNNTAPHASSSRPTSAHSTSGSPHKVGDKVQGQFRGGTSWYNATVKAIHTDNIGDVGSTNSCWSYHIAYDDGDEEKNVPLTRIRALDVIPVAIQTNKVSAESKFKIGDKVEALYYKGVTYYPASIMAIYEDSATTFSYDVTYDDGDREKKVSESSIRYKSGATLGTATVAPVAVPMPALKFQLGDKVEGQFSGGATWYLATIQAVNTIKGTYDLVYADGDRETAVKEDKIRVVQQTPPALQIQNATENTVKQSTPTNSPKKGKDPASPRDPPSVASTGSTSGTAKPNQSPSKQSPNKNGSTAVSPKAITPKTSPVKAKAKQAKFKVNDRIEGFFEQYNQWYAGKVTAVNPLSSSGSAEHSYKILYDDGDSDNNTLESKLRYHVVAVKAVPDKVSSAAGGSVLAVTVSPFKRGEKVEGLYGGLSQWYPAVIEKVSIDSRSRDYLFDLVYEDGDKETDVPEKYIRTLQTNKTTESTTVERPASASKTRAKVEIIRQMPITSNGSDSDDIPTPRKKVTAKFKVNDRIEGFFEQYNQWYAGKVTAVNPLSSSGSAEHSYKILYDDGDSDNNTLESKLRHDSSKKAASSSNANEAAKTKGNELDNFLNELSDDEDIAFEGLGGLDAGKQVHVVKNIAAAVPGITSSVSSSSPRKHGSSDYEEDFDA